MRQRQLMPLKPLSLQKNRHQKSQIFSSKSRSNLDSVMPHGSQPVPLFFFPVLPVLPPVHCGVRRGRSHRHCSGKCPLRPLSLSPSSPSSSPLAWFVPTDHAPSAPPPPILMLFYVTAPRVTTRRLLPPFHSLWHHHLHRRNTPLFHT